MNTEQKLFTENVTNNFMLNLIVNEEDTITAIAAQFALESNWGKSKIAIENHNICGMKLAKVRPTTAIGEANEHAKYLSTNFCIIDFIQWLLWNKVKQVNLANADNYLKWLQTKHYAEDKDYIKKIKVIYNEIKKHYGNK